MPSGATLLSKPVREKRKHRRIPINLPGRFMRDDTKLDAECQAVNITPEGIFLQTSAPVRLNEAVVLYLDQLGRFEGRVARMAAGGFAMSITLSSRRLLRLDAQLNWLSRHARSSVEDSRRHVRILPKNTRSHAITATGRRFDAELIDVSQSGASFTTMAPLDIGAVFKIGRTPARVISFQDDVFAAEFLKPFADDKFNRDIVL